MTRPPCRLPSLLFCLPALALTACSQLTSPPDDSVEIAILGLNDFHGHIQSAQPTPRQLKIPDTSASDGWRNAPAGGAAYLASGLAALRARHPHHITVGVGDLIGASPLASALLDDEPALEALNRLGLSLSVVGNHEFDSGRQELERKISGQCPENGCKLPEFRGAGFTYLAANVYDRATGRPFLPAYVIREIGAMKIAFIGTPLKETPNMVDRAGIASLAFHDEASTINALIPEVRAQGAQAIVALLHQGADYPGHYNDPSYACPGLQGPAVEIVKALDPAVKVVMSAHTHQGYTCKLDGRLLTQGYSYGALLTEIRLKFDRRSGELISADAENHPLDHTSVIPDRPMQAWVEAIEARSAELRQQPAGKISRAIGREAATGFADTPLGNLIADAQWQYARQFEPVDLALTNPGGIRADLPAAQLSNTPISVSFGDLFATQPFRNQLVIIDLSGQALLNLLNAQWQGAGKVRFLQVSSSLSYRWHDDPAASTRIEDVRIHGETIDTQKIYRVVMNSFMANGGDQLGLPQPLKDSRYLPGMDVDALRWYFGQHPVVSAPESSRITRH